MQASITMAQRNNDQTKRILTQINIKYEEMVEAIKQQDAIINRMANEYPQHMYIASDIVSQLNTREAEIKQAASDWKDGKFNDGLVNIFNVTKDCYECVHKRAIPLSCKRNRNATIYQMVVDVPLQYPEAEVLTAWCKHNIDPLLR